MGRSVLLWFLAGLAGGATNAADLSDERQQQLEHLLKHDCGSCHGMRLSGGLGPALTQAALHGKSAEVLRNTILYGRSGTPMPPFDGLLSVDEVDWLVSRMRSGGG